MHQIIRAYNYTSRRSTASTASPHRIDAPPDAGPHARTDRSPNRGAQSAPDNREDDRRRPHGLHQSPAAASSPSRGWRAGGQGRQEEWFIRHVLQIDSVRIVACEPIDVVVVAERVRVLLVSRNDAVPTTRALRQPPNLHTVSDFPHLMKRLPHHTNRRIGTGFKHVRTIRPLPENQRVLQVAYRCRNHRLDEPAQEGDGRRAPSVRLDVPSVQRHHVALGRPRRGDLVRRRVDDDHKMGSPGAS